jgi:hypothetical protein
MNETIKATGTPCPRGKNTVGKAFGENALPTIQRLCSESGEQWPPILQPVRRGVSPRCDDNNGYEPKELRVPQLGQWLSRSVLRTRMVVPSAPVEALTTAKPGGTIDDG